MKISNDTLTILKNFSSINNGILFKKGNVVSSVSAQRNILAEAFIEEDIPMDFGIFDLSNFLLVISLFKGGTADLEFTDTHVIIKGSDGRSQINYIYNAPSLIYDDKNQEIINKSKRPSVSPDISFVLDQNDFERIIKASNVLQSPNISVESDGDKIKLVSFDAEVNSAPTHTLILPDSNPNGDVFKLIFKSDHLKILPKTYLVEISSKGISKFSDKDGKVNYWITLETNSTYN